MKRGFHKVLWDKEPMAVETIADGKVRVNTNIKPNGEQFESISCEMSAAEAAAYFGAQAFAFKREQEIQDEVILNLIEEGSL